MAIYLNGNKIAGKGKDAKSPYEVAKDEGYAGTQQEFNTALKNIFDTEIVNTKVQNIENSLSNYITSSQIDDILEEKEYATIDYVNNNMGSGISDIFTYGLTAPSNTKLLWIDLNTSTGGLKYYNGSAWVHVPVAWQ